MDVLIKRLGEDDLVQMRELNVLFGDVFKDDSYIVAAPRDEYLKDFLADVNHIVMVAISEENIIGGLVAYTMFKYEQERNEVFIYDLAVANSEQRKGTGKALIAQLRTIAKENGAHVVFVQADEGDEAVKFYESLGPSENIPTRNFDFLT